LSLTLCCLAASGCADRRRSPPKAVVFVPPQAPDAPAVFGPRAKAVMSAVGKAGAGAQMRLAQEEQRLAEQPQAVHQDEPPAKVPGTWSVEVKGWGATQEAAEKHALENASKAVRSRLFNQEPAFAWVPAPDYIRKHFMKAPPRRC